MTVSEENICPASMSSLGRVWAQRLIRSFYFSEVTCPAIQFTVKAKGVFVFDRTEYLYSKFLLKEVTWNTRGQILINNLNFIVYKNNIHNKKPNRTIENGQKT